jgi:hypothetical protein
MNQARWQKIESLYFEALDHPVVGRNDFLRSQSADDFNLYREVCSLIEAHEQDGDFLSEPEFHLGLQVLTEPCICFPRVFK